MDSGRSTPVAMSRPSSRHDTSETNLSNLASNTRPPESRSISLNQAIRMALQEHTPMRRPETFNMPVIPADKALDPHQSCVLKSILEDRASSLAIIHGSMLTAIGLGWAVYSRIFRFNLQLWISKFSSAGVSPDKDVLSAFVASEDIRTSVAEDGQPRINISPPQKHVEFAPTVLSRDEAAREPRLPEANAKRDRMSGTQSLLQKHFTYLEPWVSNQNISPNEDIQTSPSHIEDELRRMSLPSFTDLSTAIYRDVRRREQESSPESPNPPQNSGWDNCLRNRENDARMVLCRTINEQYLRLVLALVLELARRIAEIRIGVKRRAVVMGN